MSESATSSEVPRLRGPHYPYGVAMVAGSGMCFSFIGLTMRHLEAADGWQVLFYRGVAATLVIGVFMLLRSRERIVGDFRRIGPFGVLYAVFIAAQFSCYVFAIINTSVANTVFIMSSSPLFAALLGWLVLREKVSKTTSIAIVAVIAGVGLMIGGGIVGGTWFGDLIALGIPACYAVMFVILRRAVAADMIPAAFLGSAFATIFAAFMAPTLVVSTHDLLLMLLMGAAMVSAALILLTLGGRYVPAAEIGLLAMTEAVFAPIWVWLFLGETPPLASLIGGALVLSAVAGQAIVGLRSATRA